MSLRMIGAVTLACCALFFVACKPKAATVTITVGGAKLYVEIAKTPAQRQLGLMFRKSMPENHGMLFIFPRDEHLSFWMKNTHIPLSIAFISAGGTIRGIHHMAPLSLEAINSTYAVRYALEVNQGEFARLGVKPGDSVTFPPNLPRATQ